MQQQYHDYHEQLGGGAAYAAHADDGTGTTIRIVPISEGERTVGHRKTDDDSPAIWDRDLLRDAVEQNRLVDPTREDNSMPLIVRGRGGANPHHSFEEQVRPDDILGRIDRWEYEEGTGPVGYAQLADEDIANRIELGLLEVSGDWLRRLGEYDESREGKPVTEIVGLPRIHVLERGAAAGASIDIAPETAEALGYNPDSDPHTTIEQHATSGDAVRWQSSSGGDREPASERYGVVVDNLQNERERDRLVAVYQPTENYDGWETRNEQNVMSNDSLEIVGPNGKASLPTVSSVVEQDASLIDRLAARVSEMLTTSGGDVALTAETPDEDPRGGDDQENEDGDEDVDEDQRTGPSHENGADSIGGVDEQHSDDAGRNPGSETDANSTTDTMADTNQDDLREQLATVKSEKDSLKNEKDDLEEQLSETESELEDVEEQLSDKDERINSLEDEVAPLKELLAEIAAEGSMLNPEKIAETHSTDELVDMLADDADEDKSYSDKVRELLSSTVNPRGDASGTDDEVTEEDIEAANDRAFELISGTEVSQMADSDISPAQFVKERKGVDPHNYSSRESLRIAYENQGEN